MTTPTERLWPALTPFQRRILGVLVEKSKTTPDAYPMTINGLVTGANQKTNRDPIMDLADDEVETVLGELQKLGLVIKLTNTGRVDKWRHNLYDAWSVDKIELAILTELFLRGAQTEGELRGRASRMEDIPDLESLRAKLKPMIERKLIVYLTAESKRGAMLTHCFLPPSELERLKATAGQEPAEPIRSAPATPTIDMDKILREALNPIREELVRLNAEHAKIVAEHTKTSAEVQKLRAEAAALQGRLAQAEVDLRTLKTELGIKG